MSADVSRNILPAERRPLAPKVARGASWYDIEPDFLLSSCRNRVRPEFANDTFGFRVVLAGGALA